MKSMKVLFCTAVVAFVALLDTHSIIGADVTGDRANIGTGHTLFGTGSSITGGANNTSYTNWGWIGGGSRNIVTNYGSIGGGQSNQVYYGYGTIGGGAFNVAGSYAAIAGGYANLAGTYSFVGGGVINDAAGAGNAAIAGGFANQVGGNFGFIGAGAYNTNLVEGGVISGGVGNSVWGFYSTIPGGYQALAGNFGQMAYASGQFVTAGDAQSSLFVLRRTTTTSTTNELFLDGDGAGYRLYIPAGSVYAFEVLISAGSTNGNAAGYRFDGVIKNVAGTTSTVGVVNKTVIAEDVASWDAFVEADNANDSLSVRARGDSARVRWVARVKTSEVAP